MSSLWVSYEIKQTAQLIDALLEQNDKLKKEIEGSENILSLNRIHYRKSEYNYVKHNSELEHRWGENDPFIY